MAFVNFRPASLALVLLASGLAVIPACKKKEPPKSDSPSTPNPAPPGPSGNGGTVQGPSWIGDLGNGTGGGSTSEKIDAAAPKPPVFAATSPRGAAARQASQQNLKQMMLAMHNYHDVNGYFPAGIIDSSGKVGLSWRVAILPYLEHENLYKLFHLDEPWDSEHNKKLILQMPKVFDGTAGNGNGYTFYRAFSGPGTIMPPSTGGQPKQLARGLRITGITDGTSNTFAIAEAYAPVIWTKPDELVYSANGPAPKVGGLFGQGYNVAFCDGSVRFLTTNALAESELKAFISVSGGEVVNIP